MSQISNESTTQTTRESRNTQSSRGPLLKETPKHPHEIQAFNTISRVPIGLNETVRADSVAALNQILVDTMTLRDLYKKHHWQTSGVTFYQLHLLYDKHHLEQLELVDKVAERVQTLGGIAVAMSADIAEMTLIPRAPRGRENVPAQLTRTLEAHEMLLQRARSMAKRAAELGDDGTNDLLVSDIIRTNEMQVWFLAEHLEDGTRTKSL